MDHIANCGGGLKIFLALSLYAELLYEFASLQPLKHHAFTVQMLIVIVIFLKI